MDARTGEFRNERIPPRRYEGVLYVESLGVVPLNVIEVGAGETHDLGTFLVPAPATLEVDWRWPGEDPQYSYALEQIVAIRGGPC